MAEHLCSFNDLFVLQAGELENFGYGDLDDLFSDVEDGFMTVSDNTHYVHDYIGYPIEEIEDEVGSVEVFNRDIEDNRMASSFLSWYYNVDVYDDLYDLADEYKQELQLLKPEQLYEYEYALLNVFNRYSNDLAKHCEFIGRHKHFVHNDSICPNGDKRKIHIGNSLGSAEAWTDGRTFIALDREVVNVCIKRRGDGIMYLLLLVLHEYTHTSGSVSENIHGADFYEFFHEAVISPTIRGKKYGGLHSLAEKCGKEYVRRLDIHGMYTPASLIKDVGFVSDSHVDKFIKSLKMFDMPVKMKMRGEFSYRDVDKRNERYLDIRHALRELLSNKEEKSGNLRLSITNDGRIEWMRFNIHSFWYMDFEILDSKIPDYNNPDALNRFILELKADVAYFGVIRIHVYTPRKMVPIDFSDEYDADIDYDEVRWKEIDKLFKEAVKKHF